MQIIDFWRKNEKSDIAVAWV